MRTRQAACEACRKSKLACDHKLPVCTRCETTGRGSVCTYRASPFKRKRTSSPGLSQRPQQRSKASTSASTSPAPAPTRSVYPNPGYLGYSSHAAIFGHISPHDEAQPSPAILGPPLGPEPTQQAGDDSLIQQGAEIIRQALLTYDVRELRGLVDFWTARDINFSLAEPLLASCVETVARFGSHVTNTDAWFSDQSQRLFRNSNRTLELDRDTTSARFCAQFSGDNIRWETLSFFFTAVGRATFDVSFFPSLYKDPGKQVQLRRFATKISDFCLDCCLSLDCLNDLQLMLQYENFLLHSNVDGDQSYHSWRKIGDVIASLYALGYHQKIGTSQEVSPFLLELRKSAIAVIFAADKDLAIFLGRPPRMSKRFCVLRTPLCLGDMDAAPDGDLSLAEYEWVPGIKVSYRAATRWFALCSTQKEQILELLASKDRDNLSSTVSAIFSQVMKQWDHLPPEFRLEGSLKMCDQTPFCRDFLVTARLDHLHTLFLLRLLTLDRVTEPDDSILEISQNMLSLVVEAILLRDHLLHSGTNLSWKVAYYGLPAAGMILLGTVKQHRVPETAASSQAAVLQNLSVLVAEGEMGTIVRSDEPNFALLSQAIQTIKIFLNSAMCWRGQEVVPDATNARSRWAAQGGSNGGGGDSVLPQLEMETWDYEIGFWQNLADYSTFFGDAALDMSVASVPG